MNRKELIEVLIKDRNLSSMTKKQANQFIDVMLETIKRTVKKGEDVTLVGFGTFTKSRKASRLGVNPSTGERIRIRARVVPKFKPGKPWKDIL
ncbi:MAG: HU family DNA-binding protein [Bacteriovoracaceae bacterium]|nr:HU family DNA-binding protein [Bacteriovoracaceae bacterium]